MRRFWDTVAVIILGLFAVSLLFNMIRPYGLLLVVGILAVFTIERVVKHYSNW